MRPSALRVKTVPRRSSCSMIAGAASQSPVTASSPAILWPPRRVSSICKATESSVLEASTALMPPAAMTDCDRSEGNGEASLTWMPFSAREMAQLSPDIPLPITSTVFIAIPSYMLNRMNCVWTTTTAANTSPARQTTPTMPSITRWVLRLSSHPSVISARLNEVAMCRNTIA